MSVSLSWVWVDFGVHAILGGGEHLVSTEWMDTLSVLSWVRMDTQCQVLMGRGGHSVSTLSWVWMDVCVHDVLVVDAHLVYNVWMDSFSVLSCVCMYTLCPVLLGRVGHSVSPLSCVWVDTWCPCCVLDVSGHGLCVPHQRDAL